MKHIFGLFLSLLLLLSISMSAQKNVPKQLQGYWQFKADEKGDWNGLHIGINFLEIEYDLIAVDSVRQSGNDYTVFMTHDKIGKFSIDIKLNAEDSALINFELGRMKFDCKRLDRNPEIDYLRASEYTKLLAGEWFTDNNTQQPFALKKGKLLFEGKQWNIKWFGDCMPIEYRALIENEGNFLLIYLVKQSENSWKVVYNHNPSVYSPMPADKDKYAFNGNWYEPVKNAWTYGFFEEFAIFDGKFWDYKDKSFKKNKAIFALQNGNESLELTLKKANDSTLKIALAKQKAITYKKAGHTLPQYKTADTSQFADNHFAHVDTAYITGYLRNRNGDKPFEIGLNDIIKDEQVSYFGDVDSLGRFQMKVPLYNSTMVFMDWRVMQQMVVLEPNEHYFLFYDAKTKQSLFMGENTRFNNESAAFNFFKLAPSNRQEGLSPLDLLAAKKEEYKKANVNVDRILKKMPNPSEKFRNFLANFTKYEIAFNLMQKRFELDSQNKEEFPIEYMDYVRDTLLINPPIPITLISDFSYFIRDYVGYSNDLKGNLILSSDEVMASMAKNNKLKLNKADKDLVDLFADIFSRVRNMTDSIELQKIMSKTSAKEVERYSEIYKQNVDQITLENSRMFTEMSLNRDYDAVDAVISDQIIRDYFSAASLYKNLSNNRSPIETELFDKMINRVQTPIFRDKVIAMQKFYSELPGKSLEHVESLKNTDHLKESKDVDSLWNELISPYKGKIIYVDFWGTWCGPCKREMEFVADLKKQFVGKDIIFMYFANRSPEESWKNVIKSSSLTGENVVHYRLPDEQQAMLERRFGVKHFPTYMLVDRNGNVVDTKPPQPSQGNMTVDYLKNWLEK